MNEVELNQCSCLKITYNTIDFKEGLFVYMIYFECKVSCNGKPEMV